MSFLPAKGDETKIHALAGYLKAQYGIDTTRIKIDKLFLIDPESYKVTGPYDFLNEQQYASRQIIHRPDVTILDSDLRAKIFIELDGSIHRFSRVRKKDSRRNQHYQDIEIHKIYHIIINEEDCHELGITWFEYLDAQMKKLNLFQKLT